MPRVVGSGERPRADISGVSPVARTFSVDRSRTPWRWTEASLLFHVVAMDQVALQGHGERFGYSGRSGAL